MITREKDGLSSFEYDPVTGVKRYETHQIWRVRIRISGELKHIGYFNTLDEAVIARKEAGEFYDSQPNLCWGRYD